MSSPIAPSPVSEHSPHTSLGVSNARRWTIVGLLFTASLINYFDRQTLSFALPFISAEFHLGPREKGILLSAFFWSYTLMQIPIGVLADRINLRWLYAAAFVFWSLAQGLMGLATSFGALIAFRIALGVGEAIYLPGGSKIVSLLFRPSERGLPCGLFDFGTRTGLVLEGLLVPWMLDRFGWQATFIAVGFTAMLWLIPWIGITPKRLQAVGPAGVPANAPNLAGSFRALLGNRNLLGICVGFFCFDYYWYFLMTWLPDYYVTVRHLSIAKTGIYAALPFLVFGVTEPIGGWIADRLVRAGWSETVARKGIVTLGFLTGVLLIPASQVSSASAAMLLVMGGCLVGLSNGNLLVILQGCAPKTEVGLWTGVYNFVGNIAGILAPLITGFLIDRTGSYTPPFVLAAVMIAAAPLAYWFIVGELKADG
jgi:MFS family permease